ncbi:MAG: hypothetical protein WA417_25900 [Stellaceae bacterium]
MLPNRELGWRAYGGGESTFDLVAVVKQIVIAQAQFRSMTEQRADAGTSTTGFMAGEISVPDDFDRMGNAKIQRLFGRSS